MIEIEKPDNEELEKDIKMSEHGLVDEIPIFDLTWDTPIRSFTWRLGQSVNIGKGRDARRMEISLIARDNNHFEKFGHIVYKIYIRTEDGDKLWKMIENKPVIVTFDL